MTIEYIEAALARADYEIIRDEESYYGEVPDLKGFGQRVRLSGNAGKDYQRSLKVGLLKDREKGY
jgi:hypothetical protein